MGRRLAWGDPSHLDLDSLRIAAVVAECGGREDFTPICPNHVGRRLGLNGASVGRRLRGMVHAGLMKVKPRPPFGLSDSYVITAQGLSRLHKEASPLMALVLPPLREASDAAAL